MSATDEQPLLVAKLVARYGAVTYMRALEMSGLRTCMEAMACDGMTQEERLQAYQRAGMHLAKLHASLFTKEESDRITECARVIDGAFDQWAADDVARRAGL